MRRIGLTLGAALGVGLVLCLLVWSLFGSSHQTMTTTTSASTTVPSTTSTSLPTTGNPASQVVSRSQLDKQISGFVAVYFSRSAAVSGQQRYQQLQLYALPGLSTAADLAINDSAADQSASTTAVIAKAAAVTFGETDATSASAVVTVAISRSTDAEPMQFRCRLELVRVDQSWLVSKVTIG